MPSKTSLLLSFVLHLTAGGVVVRGSGMAPSRAKDP